jgi:hypothetical protein
VYHIGKEYARYELKKYFNAKLPRPTRMMYNSASRTRRCVPRAIARKRRRDLFAASDNHEVIESETANKEDNGN